jgi:predicted NodU family carbamoyl transferase
VGKGAHHAAVPRGQNRARAVPTRIRHAGRFCPPYSLTVRILGISAFYHDSAAALVVDGRAIAAAQEERFTRKKFDAAYPRHAIDYCLRAGGLELTDIDHVVFYDKPFIKFERLLETYLSFSPKGAASFRNHCSRASSRRSRPRSIGSNGLPSASII